MESGFRATLGRNFPMKGHPMPLAFSTLGCPGDSLAQVIATAHAFGATGLELRAADGEFIHPGMSADERRTVREALAGEGLTVLALASYVKVCSPAGDDEVDADLRSAINLAADLGAANVRVFPGAGLPPCLEVVGLAAGVGEEMGAADVRGARRLVAGSGHARERGVTLLLETHDSHPRGMDVARILDRVPSDAPVKVIWDLMHPWRHLETPERTAAALAPWFAYAQFKDGVRAEEPNAVTLTLPGAGQLPLAQMLDLVRGLADASGESDPWLSLEWERTWHPELPPLAEALASLKTVLARAKAPQNFPNTPLFS